MTNNGQQPVETCGRCGYPLDEHVRVQPVSEPKRSAAHTFICPTALYLKDELQEVMDRP